MVVGVIGLGQMGSGIAKNLIEKNFSVIVHDLRAEAVEQLTEKGARAYSSAKELASLCDVVITSLPMSPPSTSLENTITGPEGVLEGMAPGKIIIDCGSTSPFITRKINQECQKKKVSFLDAPVTGGPWGAQAGTLSIMAGGSAQSLEKVKNIFEAIGRRMTYFGPSGSGQTAKLANNMIIHATLAAISEAFVFGQKAGLDPLQLFETLSSGGAQSWVLDNFGKNLLERAPGQVGLTTRYPGEQLSWALQVGRELGVPTPVTGCVQELYKMAQAAGKRGNWEQIIELWEDTTGTFFSKNI